MLSDIEIASSTVVRPISFVAEELGLSSDDYDAYGKFKAKIVCAPRQKKGSLILVTAMSPTPLGEGKTTVSIGLGDGLRKLGKKSCLALREPSLGPVFGMKGGACGGGYSQVVPMEDINLHFNGDFHAITYANNLLSSLIDNHIAQGNEKGIHKVVWKRCLDLNDRALREIEVGLGGEKNGVPRKDGFTITAACEVMAILCLAKDLNDLKRRLSNILIGYGKDGSVYAKDLHAENAMAILLKNALCPNLVQTLEGTPALVHGGPFANIAHGCNSISATATALGLADYVVTEAGFGAELGAEKFFDIKCRIAGYRPSATVLVATLRSVKYNGGADKESTLLPNIDALKKGFFNVRRHIHNLKNVFGQNVVVALNRFHSDTAEEIALFQELCMSEGVSFAVTTGFSQGGEGCISLAKTVIDAIAKNDNPLTFCYESTAPIREKICAVAQKIYHAKNVVFTENAEKILQQVGSQYDSFPVCMAKTQYSFSGDPSLLGAPKDFTLEIRDILIRTGAEFIVAQCGDILLMPGLGKVPCAVKMSIDDKGTISGLM